MFEGFEKWSYNRVGLKIGNDFRLLITFRDKITLQIVNELSERELDKEITTLSDLLHELEKYNMEYLAVDEPKEMEVFSDALKQDLYEQAQSKIITLTLTEQAVEKLKE